MKDSNCLFCKIVAGQIPCHKVYEDDLNMAFLDISPFEKGHVLVVPRFHAKYFTDLPSEQIPPLGMAVQRVAAMLLARLPCDGFNLIQNNGACATQVVPHVHFHVVPRWNSREINWHPVKYDGDEDLRAMRRRLCGEG